MAKKIYTCYMKRGFSSLLTETADIKRAVRVTALEYALENGADLNTCLATETINEVVSMVKGGE